jgi:signal transduction histidine kinase
MGRTSLAMRVFLAVSAVAAATAAAVWFVARVAVRTQLAAYMATLPQPRMGMGRGRQMVLGAAEQSFISGVNRGLVVGVIVATAIAAVVAWLLARHLSTPLERLETAADSLSRGDLSQRVETTGPEEVARLAEAFNRMADSLDTAEQLRRRMVADVAHELRNPIAALRGQIECMADGIMPIDDARLASVAEDITHLAALVDDLQQLSLADAGRLAYDRERLDVAALARREAERASVVAKPGVAVSAAAPEEPVWVSGDERRLSEVLRNLLANAARHTARGSIRCEVTVDAALVEVAVTDTGEGISAEDLDHIFERFYRADASRDATTGGAGLGLAIAKRIIEDHGGSVFATSEPGVGSRIGFRLPLG